MIDSHSGEYNPSSRSSSPPLPLRDEEEEEEEADFGAEPFLRGGAQIFVFVLDDARGEATLLYE